MGIVHFLNVKQGDCSIIQHATERVTVVDVCNARTETELDKQIADLEKRIASLSENLGVRGNFGQKDKPVNPITYMRERGIDRVFRFILTHPEMDHMDGIEDFFAEFSPVNFWDTDNKCAKEEWGEGGGWREEDWRFYERLRDGTANNAPKRLTQFSGAVGSYWNRGEGGNGKGDGLHVLAPTPGLLQSAIDCENYNDASYVILYRSAAGRVLFAGDSHDATWEHILANHRADVEDIELLIAPHHGRDSDRSYEFLDVLRPKVTLFGNASSKDLAYGAWSGRDLKVITNNQANCVVIDTNSPNMKFYVTNKSYAESENKDTYYSEDHRAYYIGEIFADAQQAAA